MKALKFKAWLDDPVTQALYQFLQELTEVEKSGIPTWDDIKNPEQLAYKMGRIHAWEGILNINKEDLKEDES